MQNPYEPPRAVIADEPQQPDVSDLLQVRSALRRLLSSLLLYATSFAASVALSDHLPNAIDAVTVLIGAIAWFVALFGFAKLWPVLRWPKPLFVLMFIATLLTPPVIIVLLINITAGIRFIRRHKQPMGLFGGPRQPAAPPVSSSNDMAN